MRGRRPARSRRSRSSSARSPCSSSSPRCVLAYRANSGLPFVPVKQLEVDVPNAARLVVGNEVREGGFRIGQVTKIAPVARQPRRRAADAVARQLRGAGPEGLDDPHPPALGARPEVRRARPRPLAHASCRRRDDHRRAPARSGPSSTTSSRPSTSRRARTSSARWTTSAAASPAAATRSTARSTRCPSCSATCRRSCARCRIPTRACRGSCARRATPCASSRRCRDELARGFTGMADTFEGASRDPAGAEGHDRALARDARRGHPLAADDAPVPQPPGGDLRRGPGHRARAAREPAGVQPRARRRHARAAPHAAVHRRPRGHAARAARPRPARRRPTRRSPA